MNSKHAIDFSSRKKKKHSMLSIAQKVELLKKYNKGNPVRNFCIKYEIRKSTACDAIKRKIFFFLIVIHHLKWPNEKR